MSVSEAVLSGPLLVQVWPLSRCPADTPPSAAQPGEGAQASVPSKQPRAPGGSAVPLSAARPFAAFVVHRSRLSETQHLLFSPLQAPGKQQGAGWGQEAEVRSLHLCRVPGEGLKREGSEWGNAPPQEIRTVGSSRCSPAQTGCLLWLALPG